MESINSEDIVQFCAITSADPDVASNYLTVRAPFTWLTLFALLPLTLWRLKENSVPLRQTERAAGVKETDRRLSLTRTLSRCVMDPLIELSLCTWKAEVSTSQALLLPATTTLAAVPEVLTNQDRLPTTDLLAASERLIRTQNLRGL